MTKDNQVFQVWSAIQDVCAKHPMIYEFILSILVHVESMPKHQKYNYLTHVCPYKCETMSKKDIEAHNNL